MLSPARRQSQSRSVVASFARLAGHRAHRGWALQRRQQSVAFPNLQKLQATYSTLAGKSRNAHS